MAVTQRDAQQEQPLWTTENGDEEVNGQRSTLDSPNRSTVLLSDAAEVMDGGVPHQPRNFAELGLSKAFLEDLTIKIIYFAGNPTSSQLMRRLGLSHTLVEQLLTVLTDEGLCEVLSRSDLYTGNYRYRLGERGRERVREALERSRYASPAPVPLDQYVEVAQWQAQTPATVSRSRAEEAVADLVLEPAVADAIIRALFSSMATLCYGPSGNGKSHVLRHFAADVDGEVLIPYAIYAYGQVIRVFDPSLHQALEMQGDGAGDDSKKNIDARWVRIRRPTITLSTELALTSLDLAYDPQSRFYQAPSHLKAQGGVLIVDDFGRQRASPRDFLARWLIALERGWDTLSLATGEQVRLPFHVQLLLATSTPLSELAEEAFLRRIPYKVKMPNPRPEGFAEILERLCHRQQVLLPRGAIERSIQVLYQEPTREPQAAHAYDLVRILIENARFDGREPALTPEAFDQAFRLFVAEPRQEDNQIRP
jgi:hypothetical protein